MTPMPGTYPAPYPAIPRAAFGATKSVWLCITTLHHRRFIEDAIHILAMPSGTRVRLRYRRPYIDKDLWHRVENGFVAPDAVALVALGVTTKEGKNVVEPLREGRIVSARCEGTVLVLDVALRDFVYEPGALGTFWHEMGRTGRQLPEAFHPKATGNYLQALSAPPKTLVASNDICAWERASEAFFRIDSLGAPRGTLRVPFLFHIASSRPQVLARLSESGNLDVEASGSIALQVHTVTPPSQAAFHNAIGEVLFELSHSAASFVSSRRVRIDSRRDVREVTISTSSLFRRSSGHLSVRTVIFSDHTIAEAQDGPRPATQREELVVARYDFPLRVGQIVPWIASALVGLAAAFAAFKLPDKGKVEAIHFLLPSCAFLLASVGVILGLRDGKR